MRNVLLTTAAAFALLATSFGAGAADLPPRPTPYAAPIVAPYNWTGIYLGINGGYAWGQQDPLNIITNRFDNSSLSFSGGVFGGTFGAQVQVGHVVLGLESDIDWANLKGTAIFNPTVIGGGPFGLVSASTKIDWISTARARVGYANENLLFYMTGGLALLGAQTNLTAVTGGAVCGAVLTNCAGASRQIGAALGTGMEYGFTPNWSAKVEYLYVTAVSLDVSHHSEVRLGINYRIGGN
jgi:outer membrane immunogenic protein